MFINGQSIDDSAKAFEKLAELAFKRRKTLDIPLLSRLYELVASIVTDGLYPAKNIEAILKEYLERTEAVLTAHMQLLREPRLACPWRPSINRRVASSPITTEWDSETSKACSLERWKLGQGLIRLQGNLLSSQRKDRGGCASGKRKGRFER